MQKVITEHPLANSPLVFLQHASQLFVTGSVINTEITYIVYIHLLK